MKLSSSIFLILSFLIYFSLDAFSSSEIKFIFLGIGLIFLGSFLNKLPPTPSKPYIKINKDNGIIASLFYTNDSLLILRFFAAFCVFSTHAVILLYPSQVTTKSLIIGCAHTGMTIFFTLSGYLMGKAFIYERYAFSREGILKFYKNRFVRIAPLAFSVFLLYVVLLYPDLIKTNLIDSWKVFAFHFLGDGPYGKNGIGALWSLSVEMQYYLLAPFIFYIFKDLLSKKINAIVFIITILLGIATLNKYFYSHFLDRPQLIFASLQGQLNYFLVGFGLNFLIKDSLARPANPLTKKAFYSQLCCLILALAAFFVLATKLQFKEYRLAMKLACIITCGLIFALERFGKNAAHFSKEINLYTFFQALGGLSYGFYLWHSGIGSIYFEKIHPAYQNTFEYLIEAGVLFLITLTVSIWSYVFIERHFQRKN